MLSASTQWKDSLLDYALMVLILGYKSQGDPSALMLDTSQTTDLKQEKCSHSCGNQLIVTVDHTLIIIVWKC